MDKIMKKLNSIKKELPFCVHPGIQLSIDQDDNIYWVFGFHTEIIYKDLGNGDWEIYDGNFKDLAEMLDSEDVCQNEIKISILQYLKYKILENKPREEFSLEDYREEIESYESIFRPKQQKLKTRRKLQKLSDRKFTYFYDFLIEKKIEERIEKDFLKNFIRYLEEELAEYLGMKEAFWIDQSERKSEFDNPLHKLNSVEQFREFIKTHERLFACVSIYYEEEVEIYKKLSRDEISQNDEKENGKMEIEEDEEEFHLKKRRATNRIDDLEEIKEIYKKKEWKLKRINLKFWNYYIQNLKNMWRDFNGKLSTKSEVFFSLIVFGVILIRFLTNKIEKLKEKEEQQR